MVRVRCGQPGILAENGPPRSFRIDERTDFDVE